MQIVATLAMSISCTGATNTVVMSDWFGEEVVSRDSFTTNVLPMIMPYPVSTYAYPDDWYIVISDAGSKNVTGSVVPHDDMYDKTSGSHGVYRIYRVAAFPEDHIGEYAYERTDVVFTIYDRDNCVEAFTNNILVANGVTNGTVIITGTDTNGLSQKAVATLTKVNEGKIIEQYAYESETTGRYLLASNAWNRLRNVATDANNLVEIQLCRGSSHTYEKWKSALTEDDYWYCPRQLCRFGTGGRIISSEWSLKSCGARVTPNVLNKDFFWPELQDSMRCFTIDCHEVNDNNSWMPYQRIAVSPHYRIQVAHYGYANNHYYYYQTSLHSASSLAKKGNSDGADLGKVQFDGTSSYADIRLTAVSSDSMKLDRSLCAKFATYETLDKLSKSGCYMSVGFTLTTHQTVNPFCVFPGSGSIRLSWSGVPKRSDRRDSYKPPLNANDPISGYADILAPLEHGTHMFDSGDVVFIATPEAKIIPLFMFTSVSGGSSILKCLENIDRMIREDSTQRYGVEEGLEYWTFEDLYWGGTNTVENAQ